MSLSGARIVFTRCFGKLLVHADELGYEVALDETKRHPMVAEWNATHCRVSIGKVRCEKAPSAHPAVGHAFKPIGIRMSTHRDALAGDLILYVAGNPSSDRALFEPLGAFWKGLHPALRWGGDFKGFPDLGHFSHEWQGRQ